MVYLITKAAVSGIAVLLISEIARRSPGLGGLVAALPVVSIFSFLWLWQETGDLDTIASLSAGTFWFVLPTLPMFLVLPVLLRAGFGFWPSLIAVCAMTMALYVATAWLLGRFGIVV
jgi:hypothetical protein